MNEWLDNAISRAASVDDWLHQKRSTSLALLRESSWPTRKTERWRYTSVRKLEKKEFSGTIATSKVDTDAISGLDSIDVVFIDGVLQTIPIDLPQGLSVTPLAQAANNQQRWAFDLFANIKPKHHFFGLINDALATSGVIIDVAPHFSVERPIRIVQVMTAGNEAHLRVLVRLGVATKATVIEHLIGDGESLITSFAEYDMAENASLEHYRLILQSGAAINIGGSHFNLAEQANLVSTMIGYGCDLARVDIDIYHKGEGTAAKLNAIYLLDKQEHFDLQSNVEHTVPKGTTEENIRGIVGGKAHAVFNGRIYIHQYAQKTIAELNNRNLLLSREAEVDTKPELEIYADDVSCAHGATIAEVDQSALYYLRSRGIELWQAQMMLNFGFINELIDEIPNNYLANWLRQKLSERFTLMSPVPENGMEITQ